MDDRDDPDRAAILARRGRFIAIALTGLVACDDGAKSNPRLCLKKAPPRQARADGGPDDDLPPDAGSIDAGAPDASTPDATWPDATPPDAAPPNAAPSDAATPDARRKKQPCLKIGKPHRPCLEPL